MKCLTATGTYTPPDCPFTNVLLTLTVVSAGHQFDRLALMYLGDTELWRTSTAEPTEAGIIWTHRKDATPFVSLWREPQKIIFDLGNVIDETYTGAFNTTLTATFFTAEGQGEEPADVIIPLSARRAEEDKASAWHIPETDAVVSVSNFPRNAHRAVLSVSANGQQGEEFWWYNMPEADTLAFEPTAGALAGLSPFREVQVFLDGEMVGVQWPFPVIFTGGISPNFHRPVVGIQAFDLREAEIDVSPWLPVLCDGGEHTFEVRVAGIDDSGGENVVTGTVGSYWVVTGKIFVWVDEDGESVTAGGAPAVSGTGPQDLEIEYTERELLQSEGFNESLRYTLETHREMSITNTITTKDGERNVSWTQSLTYTNHPEISSFGLDQLADLVISSHDEASADGAVSYLAVYAYPLRMYSAIRMDAESGNYTVNSTMQQALELAVGGNAVFPSGAAAFGDLVVGRVSTARVGAAYLFRSGDGTGGYGAGYTNQTFVFEGTPLEGEAVPLYAREVSAENDVVLSDRETMGGDELSVYSVPAEVAGGKAAEWAGESSVGKGLGVKLSKLAASRGEAGMEVVFGL